VRALLPALRVWGSVPLTGPCGRLHHLPEGAASLQETEVVSFNKELNLEVWLAMALVSGRPSAMLG
jgi:hypothetical protein